MARGSNAKIEVVNKLQSAFGENFIGEIEKKYYVWANDGGEMVQIAITLTCPKTNVDTGSAAPVVAQTARGGLDFDHMVKPVVAHPVAEISEAEQMTINDMLKRLNL